jgi:hypothetical protein
MLQYTDSSDKRQYELYKLLHSTTFARSLHIFLNTHSYRFSRAALSPFKIICELKIMSLI